MSKTAIISMNRRRLLLGTAAFIVAGIFEPVMSDVSSDIVIQDGWLLKKGDLS